MPKRTREQWEESPSPEVSDSEATDSGGGGADSGDMEVDQSQQQSAEIQAVAFGAESEDEIESMDLDEEEHEPSDEEDQEPGTPSQSFDRRWVNEYYPNKDALDPYQGPFMKKRTPFRTHPPMDRLLDWMLDNEDAFNK